MANMMQVTVTPPPPPGAPQAPAAIPKAATASEMYDALRAQRRELERQLEQLEGRRSQVSREISEHQPSGPALAGLEARITDIDRRIADVEKQIAASDQAVAQAAAVPGAVRQDPPAADNGQPPEEALIVAIVFTSLVLLPLSIALARRLWRRGTTAVTALPAELRQRLARLEESLDAIAVEVERIGEGQRFTHKLFAERALGAGAAQPLPARDAEPVPVANRER